MSIVPNDLATVKSSLRDLSDAEMVETYGGDRFTISVISSRLRYIIEHVCTHLVSRAFSPILRDYTDLSAAIAGPPSEGFPVTAVSQTLPLFFGSMPDAVRIACEEYGIDDFEPGDILLVNDPYRVGTHLNDVCLIRPVFFDGVMAGAITIRAHMMDWGGKAAGGFAPDKANLFEDGLVIPPSLIFSKGEKVKSMFQLIRTNTRFPDE